MLFCAIGLTGVIPCGVTPVAARDRVDFPNPVGYVNDFANVLTNDDEIDAKLRAFDETETTQILVITVDELPEDLALEEFVPTLTDNNPEWAAGQEKFDNGVILTVVMGSRDMRIDVGYGLEGALPDITTKHILDNEIKPYFKAGDYNSGVDAGVNAIMDSVKGEYTAETTGDEDVDPQWSSLTGQCFVCGIVFLFFIIPYLGAYFSRSKSWWMGGVVGFIMAVVGSIWLATFSVLGVFRYLGIVFLGPALTILGLLFDFIVSRTYKVRKKRGLSTGFFKSFGGFSSGSSGSSFSSGGSSGGFSSGGGSFGGGGSSSSW